MKVKELLDKAKVEYKLIKLKDKAVSAGDVIKHSNTDRKQICKTIILRDKKKNYYAVFIKGFDLIDKNKVKKIVGKKVSLATHDDVLKATGVEPGCVCPLLLDLLVIVDKEVLKLKTINLGSGEFIYGLEMELKDLLSLLNNYKVEDIRHES